MEKKRGATPLENTLSSLMYRVNRQSENKVLWETNDSPIAVANMIAGECKELQTAINDDEEAFEIASEIGDVLYLTLKLCSQLGIKPEDAVNMKIIRNDLKYPNDLNSFGDTYEGAREKSKTLWEAMGGDIAFSHAYLELCAESEEPLANEDVVVYNADDYSI